MIQLSSAFAVTLVFACCYAVLAKKSDVSQVSQVCHVCATNYISRLWSHFLPHLPSDQAPQSGNDYDCKMGQFGRVDPCSGPCFILNATTHHENGSRSVFGMARGCSDILLKSVPEIDTDRKCDETSINIATNRFRLPLNVEWCFCNGAMCNGQADWSTMNQDWSSLSQGTATHKKWNRRRKLEKNSAGGSAHSPLLLLACFLVASLFSMTSFAS